MAIYWVGFIAIAFSGLFLEPARLTPGVRRSLMFILGLCLLLIAGLQGVGVSRDYLEYRRLYAGFSGGYGTTGTFYEPIFVTSAIVGGALGLPVNFSIILHVSVSLFTKFLVFARSSLAPVLSLALYYSYFFFLQDVTQIRIAAGLGVAYLGIVALVQGRKIWFWSLMLLAACFHFSTLALIPAYWVVRLRSLRLCVMMVACGIGAALLATYIGPYLLQLESILALDPTGRLPYYAARALSNAAQTNAMTRLAPHAFLLTALFVCWHQRRALDVFGVVWIALYSFGVLVFGVLSIIPEVAYRVSDMYLFSMVLAVPVMLQVVTPRIFARFLIVLAALIFLLYVLYGVNLVGPYVPFWSA